MNHAAAVIYLDAMKRAVAVVRAKGWTDEADPSKPLQVTRYNWEQILRDAGEPIPELWAPPSAPDRPIPGERRGKRAVVRPVEAPDGSLSLTCRICAEAKSVKKFPTTSNGGRESRCRACRDAAKKSPAKS